ncbi:MAG: hypothetical protein HRU15_05340 [Planctomycetes bacterium]|nr:hypothetical protein [Planctomycetota bacterium]
MSDSKQDPLWHALVEGDESCPDGQALAKLGQLLRHEAHSTASADFASRVLAASTQTSEDDLVDAMYDGDQEAAAAAADPGLAKLRKVTRSTGEGPASVNLLPDVLDGLRRRRSQAPDSIEDNVTRWRIWSTVIFGHVAALITVTVLWSQFSAENNIVEEMPQRIMHGSSETESSEKKLNDQYMDVQDLDHQVETALSNELPQRWSQLKGQAEALFVVRQNSALKKLYRSFYGSDGSQATVHAALSWLQAQQHKNGSFAQDTARRSSRTLATHSLATLALLGEGINDSNRQNIIAACNFLKEWIDQDAVLVIGEENTNSEVAQGMAILSLIEASILLQDQELKQLCEKVIAANTLQHLQHNAGLNGYYLLALETAETAGIKVDNKTVLRMRQHIRSGMKQSKDLGKSGIHTFTRYINGFRDAEMKKSLHIFAERLPRSDEQQRVDPISWFFPSLALREAGSIYWSNWNSSLQRELLSCFTYDNAKNHAWIPGKRVRHANGDAVFATAIALMNLQAAYRYVPLL